MEEKQENEEVIQTRQWGRSKEIKEAEIAMDELQKDKKKE